jgi:large subunit ribosomal protein L31
MQKTIHPKVGLALFRCASCANRWIVSSTKLDGRMEEHEGKQYPAIVVETCSNCHPYYTDKQTFIDTAGRVEKFQKRFAKFSAPAQEAEKK